MKYILTLAALAILAIGCTKTKTVTVTVPVHDTTVINTTDTVTDTLHILDPNRYAIHLVGSWTNNIPSQRKPTFTLNSLTLVGTTSFTKRYVASGDTIFFVEPHNPLFPAYNYSISTGGDTLTIIEVSFPTNVYTYWRI